MAKNPEMDKRTAFAIATQQAHAIKHTPKGFGTAEGKKKAKAKYSRPKKNYVQTADPKKIGKKLEKAEKNASDKAGFYHGDIESDTLDNDNYRKVLSTGKHTQLVAMSIPPGEDIGLETHPTIDQFFRIESGKGVSSVDGKEFPLKDAVGLVVPAGAKHNITSTGKEPLKLYSLYSPPNHPPGTLHKTKADQPMEKDADGDDGPSQPPTKEQQERIREFIRRNRLKNDDEFHNFVEGMGVEAHDAEPVVYQMAHDSAKTAEEHSVMNKSPDLVKLEGFSDEFYKLAMESKLAAGAWQATKNLVNVARGKPTLKWSLKALKDPKTRGDTLKMMAAQTAIGGAAVTGGVVGARKIKKKHRKRLGKAYVLGARDMYGRLHQAAMRRAKSGKTRPAKASPSSAQR